ncbi:MAG TPA: DUF2062 domain-containing protein [Polyangiaceae bacterium]
MIAKTASGWQKTTPPTRSFSALWRRLRGGELTPYRAAASIGLGLFIGCLPVYGLHFPLCALVCWPFRLDLVSCYLAANISNPLMAPVLLVGEVELGALVLTGSFVPWDIARAQKTGVMGFAGEAALGAVLAGCLLGTIGGCAAWHVVRRLRERRHSSGANRFEAAIAKTIGRYRKLPRGHRVYVSAKLRLDPVLRCLVDLNENLGRVLDLGAGRGQLGLCLYELGLVRSLLGYDSDPSKVQVARQAAGDDAVFECEDVRHCEIPASDTLLVIDLLHYLPPDDQTTLLDRLARAVPSGGRLILREVDSRAGMRARLTRWAERIGRFLGVNRGPAMAFPRIQQIVEGLRSCGLDCRIESASQGTPLANSLIIARRRESSGRKTL